ncbi:FG-GAP repeat domain-containing protein [Intrasporangium flavum]|uniref:FG-GAP repeat domain-containing protein n=1 Tax=Intrasporangium flavum TaxID=1428657 RepID=UPI00096EAF62|nr:VCBS repeat-containing protein [Intrasporangium flavum]
MNVSVPRRAQKPLRRAHRRVPWRRAAALAAAFALAAPATAARAADAAGTADLISKVMLHVVLDADAFGIVTAGPAAPSGTTYTYVWSDETGELGRKTTTDKAALTPIGRAKFGRTVTLRVTATAPDGATETESSVPVVATRWRVGGLTYDDATRRFAWYSPQLPATFDAELGPVTVSYQWSRSGTPIPAEPGVAPWVHTRAAADEGQTLSVAVVSHQASTGAGSTWASTPTPQVGVVQVAYAITGSGLSGQTLAAEVRPTSWYPGDPTVVPELTCDHQWYRDGAAVYGETGPHHYVHTMERGRMLQARTRCTSPGYLPQTFWSAKLVVPGVPALVSLLGNDAVRDLGEYQGWTPDLWLNKGRPGSFYFGDPLSTSYLPTRSMSMVSLAGDLDDDGRDDLLARDSGGALWLYPFVRDRVRIGASGWGSMNLLVAGGDFTGDRSADLFARRSTGELVFYAGRGRQGLAAGKVVATSAFRSARHIVTLGDANGDGLADLHVVRPDGTLWFYPGRGNGGLAAPVRVGTGWGSMTRLLTGRDLDRDGKVDLLALDPAGRLWLYPGNGRGGFTARSLTNAGHPLTTAIS